MPIAPAGRELRLNVRSRRGGSIRVGIVGSRDRTVDTCAPIHGDHLAIPVHWQAETDIGAPAGEPVTLHFKLRAAELFGFEWI